MTVLNQPYLFAQLLGMLRWRNAIRNGNLRRLKNLLPSSQPTYMVYQQTYTIGINSLDIIESIAVSTHRAFIPCSSMAVSLSLETFGPCTEQRFTQHRYKCGRLLIFWHSFGMGKYPRLFLNWLPSHMAFLDSVHNHSLWSAVDFWQQERVSQGLNLDLPSEMAPTSNKLNPNTLLNRIRCFQMKPCFISPPPICGSSRLPNLHGNL